MEAKPVEEGTPAITRELLIVLSHVLPGQPSRPFPVLVVSIAFHVCSFAYPSSVLQIK